MLARELQAISGARRMKPAPARSHAATALTVPVIAPRQKHQPSQRPRKRTPVQSTLAAIFSAVLTGGLAAYILMAQGEFGKAADETFAAYVQQDAVPTSIPARP